MVQEEKVTLKPPQEGETEEQSRKIPFLSPSSLPHKQGAFVPRDIHGEIVYPAVNHPPDTHCKEKRLGGSKMPLSPSSPERQALQSS
ncbi:unnamed protein product [Microthlaspi erraticum]|uniref:Uncharacterized protein n=1 Tax=Microthlaspi erraticum TaxID=1685480 RepID=A0A6D2KV03_9BRAS|nr:unnamed protein product [Microthlaspi erraticum]